MQQGQLLAEPVMQIAGDFQALGLALRYRPVKQIVDAGLGDVAGRDVVGDADQVGGRTADAGGLGFQPGQFRRLAWAVPVDRKFDRGVAFGERAVDHSLQIGVGFRPDPLHGRFRGQCRFLGCDAPKRE